MLHVRSQTLDRQSWIRPKIVSRHIIYTFEIRIEGIVPTRRKKTREKENRKLFKKRRIDSENWPQLKLHFNSAPLFLFLTFRSSENETSFRAICYSIIKLSVQQHTFERKLNLFLHFWELCFHILAAFIRSRPLVMSRRLHASLMRY